MDVFVHIGVICSYISDSIRKLANNCDKIVSSTNDAAVFYADLMNNIINSAPSLWLCNKIIFYSYITTYTVHYFTSYYFWNRISEARWSKNWKKNWAFKKFHFTVTYFNVSNLQTQVSSFLRLLYYAQTIRVSFFSLEAYHYHSCHHSRFEHLNPTHWHYTYPNINKYILTLHN